VLDGIVEYCKREGFESVKAINEVLQ